MPQTKNYEPEFKKIVRLYLEEGRTIKSIKNQIAVNYLCKVLHFSYK